MVLFFQNFDKNLDFGVLFFQKISPALRAGFYFHFFLLKIPLFSLVKLQKPEKVPKIFALRAGFIFSFSKFQLGVLLFQNLKLFFRLMVAKTGGFIVISAVMESGSDLVQQCLFAVFFKNIFHYIFLQN